MLSCCPTECGWKELVIVADSTSPLPAGATVLVTGGGGFICSHVADRLLVRGYRVTIVDDLSSGNRDNLPPGATFFDTSIVAPELRAIFRQVQPHAVVHGAAQVKVVRSMEDPGLDLTINVEGTRRVLELAKESGVGRFVFISTGGAMYGDTEVAAAEESLPKPSSYYAVHKYTAERYVEMSGLSYGILRLSNVYGPRQRSDLEGGVVAIFLDRLQAGETVTVFGSGEQARDFVYVDDVAQALVMAVESGISGLWNVGVGEPTTVNQILDTLGRLYRPPVEVRHGPPRPGEIYRAWLDSSRIRQQLGWSPRFSLEAGIRDLLHRSGLDAPERTQ